MYINKAIPWIYGRNYTTVPNMALCFVLVAVSTVYLWSIMSTVIWMTTGAYAWLSRSMTNRTDLYWCCDHWSRAIAWALQPLIHVDKRTWANAVITSTTPYLQNTHAHITVELKQWLERKWEMRYKSFFSWRYSSSSLKLFQIMKKIFLKEKPLHLLRETMSHFYTF